MFCQIPCVEFVKFKKHAAINHGFFRIVLDHVEIVLHVKMAMMKSITTNSNVRFSVEK